MPKRKSPCDKCFMFPNLHSCIVDSDRNKILRSKPFFSHILGFSRSFTSKCFNSPRKLNMILTWSLTENESWQKIYEDNFPTITSWPESMTRYCLILCFVTDSGIMEVCRASTVYTTENYARTIFKKFILS